MGEVVHQRLLLLQGMDDFLGLGIHDFVLLFRIKSGSNDGHRYTSSQGRVFPYPHDDIGIVPRFGLNEVVDFANLVDGNFFFS